MHYALFVLLVLPETWLPSAGIARSRTTSIVADVGLVEAALGLFSLPGFWGEVPGFDAVGYEARSVTEIGARIGTGSTGAGAGWLGKDPNELSSRQRRAGTGETRHGSEHPDLRLLHARPPLGDGAAGGRAHRRQP